MATYNTIVALLENPFKIIAQKIFLIVFLVITTLIFFSLRTIEQS